LTFDYPAVHSEIRHLIPYSNPSNTIFLSEYNSDETVHKNAYLTGIGYTADGEEKLGLMFYTPKIKITPIKSLTNPYAVAYLNTDVYNPASCLFSFIEYVAVKYKHTYKHLDIVIQPQMVGAIKQKKRYTSKIKKSYPTIILIEKNTESVIYSGDRDSNNILTLRADVLPLEFKQMFSLYTYSIDDILVTGDQSMTDVLTCCSKKNIWYQIVPWKKDFADQLAHYTNTKIYTSSKMSCGDLSYLKWKGNYNKILEWDFRIIGKKFINDFVKGKLI